MPRHRNRDPEKPVQLKSQREVEGAAVSTSIVDVRGEAAVARFLGQAVSEFGPFDVLVYTPGVRPGTEVPGKGPFPHSSSDATRSRLQYNGGCQWVLQWTSLPLGNAVPEDFFTAYGRNNMTRVFRSVFALALGLMMTLMGTALLFAQQEADEGWTPLFNGKNLDGWKFQLGKEGTENEGTFTIKDGLLICSGRPSGYMYTRKSYRNYTLRFEFAFKRPEGLEDDSKYRGNSGCLIHIGEKNALGIWPRSIEVQGMHRQLGLILPIPRNLNCELTFDKESRDRVIKPVGEFNAMEIQVNGGDMVISLNGTVVSTVSDCELTEGPIGLQSEGAETHWKNIRVKQK